MKYTGPKNRLARRVGMDLGLKTLGSKSNTRLLNKLNITPGQQGARKKRKVSERGVQLSEKQKLRYIFGVTEKQLKNYFKKASVKKGNTALYLSEYLERRLDNVVYRLGLAPTRAASRQLVVHGHVAVDDKKMAVPSYQVKVGEKVSFLFDKTAKIPYIEKALNNKEIFIP
ncbi:30S ribosomal protein S4, partial [Patescibacteria group bacterium]|nr:30S ribosomal protein S4 [Patescibacteria group bacterium]